MSPAGRTATPRFGVPVGVRPRAVDPGDKARRAFEVVATRPIPVVFAPVLLAAGIMVLTWDFALLPADPWNHLLYWIGLACGYAGVVALGLAGRPSAPRVLAALVALGAISWLPYLLRSPDRLVFVDELYHRDVLARILETGHATGLGVTLYPLPGTFPGLEAATTALMGMTGLAMDDAIRVMTLGLHAVIPALAWLVARGVGLGGRAAFLAALVYASNTSFGFFHAVFSYETLGIVLVLAAWALVALAVRRPEAGVVARSRHRALLGTAAVLVVAVAVTHHVSAYLLGASLLVAGVVLWRQRARSWRAVAGLGALGLATAGAWSVANADRLAPYLLGTLAARLEAIAGMVSGAEGAARQLFATPDQPALERSLAFSYPVLLLVLSIAGLVVLVRQRPRSPLWPALAVLGPIAWILTTPAVVTRSGELAYRSWPFIFIALAPVVALALVEVARAADRRRLAGSIVATLVVAVLMFGARSIGEHQSGRFPTADPPTAAGGAANTDDVAEAARWLLATAGPGHLVATDTGTAVELGTEGRQRILGWQAWYPFITGDPDRIAGFLRDTGTEYVVLDMRVTRLPARYGSYFGAPPIPDALDPGQPVPPARTAALERTPGLVRIYEGRNLVIYRFTSARAGDAG